MLLRRCMRYKTEDSFAKAIRLTGISPSGSEWTVTTDCVLSKCKWSPLEGHTFDWKVEKTFVNGHLLYNNGEIDETYRGQELRFR